MTCGDVICGDGICGDVICGDGMRDDGMRGDGMRGDLLCISMLRSYEFDTKVNKSRQAIAESAWKL